MRFPPTEYSVEDGIEETLTYMDFSTQDWARIRTNNTIESLNREVKHWTKAIGAFPDRQSALIPVCARPRHVAINSWGVRRYMNMDYFSKQKIYHILCYTCHAGILLC